MATELYIAARPFSQAVNLYRVFLNDEIMSRLIQVMSDKKSLVKTRDTLLDLRRKHPQIHPTGEVEKVSEKEGGGELARLLNLETLYLKKIDEHYECLYVELTVSLALHLNEITLQYGNMWRDYDRIFKAMLELIKREGFISSQSWHENRKLKKNVISNKVAQQDKRRREMEKLYNFSKRISDTWLKLFEVQAGTVSALQNWIQTIQKSIPEHIFMSKMQSLAKMENIKSMLSDWSDIVKPDQNTAKWMLLFDSYTKSERKLKDHVTFFDILCKRSDDIKSAAKEALEISREKGTHNIYYEKAQQKVEAVVEDNRKYVLHGLSTIESSVFSTIRDTSIALSTVYNSIKMNFQKYAEASQTPIVEITNTYSVMNETLKLDESSLEEGAAPIQRIKRFQKEKYEAMGSVPSITLHLSSDDLLSSQENYVEPQNILQLKKSSGSRRRMVDLAKEPSSPNYSRRSSLPTENAENLSFSKIGEKPPPPIPIARYNSLHAKTLKRLIDE